MYYKVDQHSSSSFKGTSGLLHITRLTDGRMYLHKLCSLATFNQISVFSEISHLVLGMGTGYQFSIRVLLNTCVKFVKL